MKPSTPRIGTALVFASHGLAAWFASRSVTTEWVGWIAEILPIGLTRAAYVLRAVGTLDLLIAGGVLLLRHPPRALLVWCVFWTAFTASLRLYFYGGFHPAFLALAAHAYGETLARAPNVILPILALRQLSGANAQSRRPVWAALGVYFLGLTFLEFYRLGRFPGDFAFVSGVLARGEVTGAVAAAVALSLAFLSGALFRVSGPRSEVLLPALALAFEAWYLRGELLIDLLRAPAVFAAVQLAEKLATPLLLSSLLVNAVPLIRHHAPTFNFVKDAR